MVIFRALREQVPTARLTTWLQNGVGATTVLGMLPLEVLATRLRTDLGRVFRDVYEAAGDAAAKRLKAVLRGEVAKYSPDQPRVPAGNPDGGEWTSTGGPTAGGGGASIGGEGGPESSGAGPHARLRKPLTDQQHVVLQDYQQGGYREINAALARGEASGTWRSDIRSLDQAIGRGVTTAPQTVYRGTTHEGLHRLVDAGRADGLIGRELNMPTFVSTSSDSTVATSFGAHEQHQVLYSIRVPKGARALPVGPATRSDINDEEHELLLPRNSTFRVTGVSSTRAHGRTIPVLELELQ